MRLGEGDAVASGRMERENRSVDCAVVALSNCHCGNTGSQTDWIGVTDHTEVGALQMGAGLKLFVLTVNGAQAVSVDKVKLGAGGPVTQIVFTTVSLLQAVPPMKVTV